MEAELADRGWKEAEHRASAAEVASPSASFSSRTAWGPDGLHVRQGLFADAGEAPEQATIVVSPLMPKPIGGRRPIIILSAWNDFVTCLS